MKKNAIQIIEDQSFSVNPQDCQLGERILLQNMGLGKGERIVILCDTQKMPEATLFFEAAKRITNNSRLVIIPPADENAQEPDRDVAALLKTADVILIITTYSMTHTHAVNKAVAHGARIASMPGITLEVIRRTLSIDYSRVERLSKKIALLLDRGNTAILTSENGTNVRFDLEGRKAFADTGLLTHPGDFGNLPGGEAFISPREGGSHGTIVFDGAFEDIVIDEPITVKIKSGHVTDIIGGEGARLLNQRLARVGTKGYNVAELGIGTNRSARLDSILLEVEKVYETVHVALGNNAHIGGEVDVPFHSDGVILKPTLAIDKICVLDKGKFVL